MGINPKKQKRSEEAQRSKGLQEKQHGAFAEVG